MVFSIDVKKIIGKIKHTFSKGKQETEIFFSDMITTGTYGCTKSACFSQMIKMCTCVCVNQFQAYELYNRTIEIVSQISGLK